MLTHKNVFADTQMVQTNKVEHGSSWSEFVAFVSLRYEVFGTPVYDPVGPRTLIGVKLRR